MAYLVGIIDPDQFFHLRMMPVRKELLEPALQANRAFLDEHDGDVEREPEVVAAWFRVAILTRLIRPRAEALEVGKTALDRQRRFSDANPDVAQYRRDLATCYHNVGFLLHAAGRSADGLELLAEARRIREELLGRQPENLDYRSELAGCLNDIGLAWSVIAQAKTDPAAGASAEQALQSARDHQRQVVRRAGHVLRYRVLLGNHLYNLAHLLAECGRAAEAATLLEELQAVQPDDPDTDVRTARVLALAAAHATGPQADELADRAIQTLERVTARDPDRGAVLLRYPEFNSLTDRPHFRRWVERVSGQAVPRRASAERQ
jgi:tetratricopeptide (TPR) repeat protein